MALDPLATIDDLSARVVGGIADVDVLRADAALTDASAAFRVWARQDITAGTTTDLLIAVLDGAIRLPQGPVAAISSITDLYGGQVTYNWFSGQVVMVWPLLPDFGAHPHLAPPEVQLQVKVTYDHGFDEIPAEVVSIVCAMAARGMSRPAESANVTGKKIDGYEETYGAGAAGSLYLTDEEQKLGRRFRKNQIRSMRIG